MKKFLTIFILLTLPAFADWREGAPLSTAIADAQGARLGAQIYVLNGVRANGFFELYDIVSDGWRPLTPLPVNLSRFSLAAGGGRIYVSGGRNKEGALTKDIWIYAPEQSLWVRRAILSQPRAGHSSIVADGKLFLLGGVATDKVQSYDIGTGTWQDWQEMPIQVANSSVAFWGDEIVLAGGIMQNGKDTNIVQALNIKTGKWRKLASLPQEASGVALVVMQNRLHALGGYVQNSQKVLDTHISLIKNNWETETSLPQGVHQMASAVTGDKIVLIGGALGGGFYALFTASDRVSIYESSSR